MQRIVFSTDDEQTALGGGSDSAAAVTAARYVTPVFPATRAEYEQAPTPSSPSAAACSAAASRTSGRQRAANAA